MTVSVMSASLRDPGPEPGDGRVLRPVLGQRVTSSAIRRVERDIARDLALPALAIFEQFLLVVEKLLAVLGRELEIGSENDGIDRAGFLTEPAIDAFRHVDIIARGPARSVGAGLGFDGDRLRRADGLAELAGNAAFLAAWIAAKRKLAPEARAERPLLERVVDGRLRLEEIPEAHPHPDPDIPEQEIEQRFSERKCQGFSLRPPSGHSRPLPASPGWR